jgi:hypothetical protein
LRYYFEESSSISLHRDTLREAVIVQLLERHLFVKSKGEDHPIRDLLICNVIAGLLPSADPCHDHDLSSGKRWEFAVCGVVARDASLNLFPEADHLRGIRGEIHNLQRRVVIHLAFGVVRLG